VAITLSYLISMWSEQDLVSAWRAGTIIPALTRKQVNCKNKVCVSAFCALQNTKQMWKDVIVVITCNRDIIILIDFEEIIILQIELAGKGLIDTEMRTGGFSADYF
jgi:hypothetical protein